MKEGKEVRSFRFLAEEYLATIALKRASYELEIQSKNSFFGRQTMSMSKFENAAKK